jgi:hypothetical protein
MALIHPEEREQLKTTAKTWRWLADVAEDLPEITTTLH